MDQVEVEDKISRQKEELKDILRNHIVDVTFTKTNGQKREMRCTLMEKYLPEKMVVNEEMDEAEKAKADRPSIDNRNVIAVWDMDIKEWRSFRITSIIDFNLEE